MPRPGMNANAIPVAATTDAGNTSITKTRQDV